MASSSISPNTYQGAETPKHCHPLELLRQDEIRAASSILVRQIQESDKGSGQRTQIHFKNISLHDPPKSLLLPHLNAEAAGVTYSQRPYVPRCIDITWNAVGDRKVTESTVSLDARTVIAETHNKKCQYGPNDRYGICTSSIIEI